MTLKVLKTVDKAKQIKEADTSGLGLYEIKGSKLYKIGKFGSELLANFFLKIISERIRFDDDILIERNIDLQIHIIGKQIPLTISSDEFSDERLMKRIYQAGGPGLILYGKTKDLRVAAQEFSRKNIQTKSVTTSVGFSGDGNFLYPGMLITSEGIETCPDEDVDLSGGKFSRQIGFLPPDQSKLPYLGRHLLDNFIELKMHDVTYPLMGHIVLSPFASWIVRSSGRQKFTVHLQGPSGGSKTFIGNLANAFFGQFGERCLSWSSTHNSIEAEGHHFRDTLLVVDDYKASIVDPRKMTRILQNYANAQGRSRLNSKIELLRVPYIRGLLLSTGEDFVSDIESVSGRSIVLKVGAEQNTKAGAICLDQRHEYRMFLPGLIQMVISDVNWETKFSRFIDIRTRSFHQKASGISNGLRIASNWALNSLGFNLFLRYLWMIGVVDRKRVWDMKHEYNKIVQEHLEQQAAKLRSQNPVEIFFRILGQKLSAGSTRILDLLDDPSVPATGKIIGKVKKDLVCIFPDAAMEVLVGHYRALGQRSPFTKETLKDALARDGLIVRPKSGRLATQVRLSGNRLQAWQFEIEDFKKHCSFSDE